MIRILLIFNIERKKRNNITIQYSVAKCRTNTKNKEDIKNEKLKRLQFQIGSWKIAEEAT